MKYYKNTELAKLYNISEKSVRNWVEATHQGKLDLQLYDVKGRPYVANTSKNTALIEKLVERGRKYKNRRSFKELSPKPKFYEVYSHKQVLDIVSNLTIHQEIPLQYSYADGGATYWDKYANRMFSEESPNLLKQTIWLLDNTTNYIEGLLSSYKRINVVDLGPGNGLPMKNFLNKLLNEGRLQRYIAIDSSEEMLRISEQNLRKWLGGAMNFEGHVRDFSRERFDDLIADETTDEMGASANLVFLFGGTLSNFRLPDQALRAINDSLGLDGILISCTKLDTPNTRRFFDFNITDQNQKLTPRHRLILDYLNIEEDYYEVEQRFDEQKQARFINIIPKIDLRLKFNMGNGTRTIELRKDKPILIWRYWHQSSLELIAQLYENDLDLLQATTTKDQEYLLLISKVKLME